MSSKNHDPNTGRFAPGNSAASYCATKHAKLVRDALREITTPELIKAKAIELLHCGVRGTEEAIFTLLLAYTLGKPTERLELTTDQGQTLFNIEILSSEDRQALESITLKSMSPETVKIIDAEFEQVKSEDTDDLREV